MMDRHRYGYKKGQRLTLDEIRKAIGDVERPPGSPDLDEEAGRIFKHIRSVVWVWRHTIRRARIIDIEDLEYWLAGKVWEYYKRERRSPPKNRLRDWAESLVRSAGFHGSNPHKAGERREPLRELPRVNAVRDEDKLDRLAAIQRRELPYGIRRGGPPEEDLEDFAGLGARADRAAAKITDLERRFQNHILDRIARAICRDLDEGREVRLGGPRNPWLQ